MNDICINLEINLKKFSSLALAEALWESNIIDKEIRTYAFNLFDEDDDKELERRWRNVIQKVINLLEFLQLPDDLFRKVESTIVFLGEKIFNWLTTFIRFEGPKPLKQIYLPKIYWTQHGVIDDSKYYQAWKKNPDKPFRFLEFHCFNFEEKNEQELVQFTIASMYADETLIRKSLPKIAKLIKDVLDMDIKDLTKFNVTSAMVILLLWYKEITDTNLQLRVMYSQLKSKQYPKGTDKMFLHSVKLGLRKPAEYFFRRLKENDKESIVQQALLELLSRTYLDGQVLLHFHEMNLAKPAEMVLYLLGKMTSERRRIFLSDKIAEVYTCFLLYWPYQELCTPLLDYFWVKIPKGNRFRILQGLFTLLKHSGELKHYTFTSTIYQPLLKDLLARTPCDLKKFIYTSSNVIFNLFKILDFSSIDVILEDTESKSLRHEIIDISKFLPNYLIDKVGHTKNINDYMDHLQMSADEKKNLLKIFWKKGNPLLQVLIEGGRLDEAEDLMAWQCGSNAEDMINLRKEVIKDSVMYCSKYVGLNKWDLIEKYVKWILADNDEESSDMKKKILSVEFVRELFWIVWINNHNGSLKLAQNRCRKLFKYFFKSEEKIDSIIKEKLIQDENFVGSVFNSASKINIKSNFSINFDEVMKFCSVSPNRVDEIKKRIVNGMQVMFWLEACVGPDQFLVINEVINWVSSNENDKKNLIRKGSVNSKKIGGLCIDFLKWYRSDVVTDACKEAIKVLFTEWVKLYGDIEEIKKIVKKFKRKNEVLYGDLRDNLLQITSTDIQKTLDLLNFCKSNPVNLILQEIEKGL